MKRIAVLLVRHRLGVLLFLAPVTLALAWWGSHLTFDFSPQAIYAGDGHLVEQAQAFEDVFGHDEAVLLVVLDARGDADVLTPPVLSWTAAFSKAAAAFPQVARVSSLATARVPEASGPALRMPRLVPLLGSDPGASGVRERLEDWFRREPLLREAYLSPDQRWMALHILLAPDARNAASTATLLKEVHGLLARLPPPRDTRVRLGGLPHLGAAVVSNLENEQVTRVPLSALVFFLVLLVAYRHLPTALAPLVAVGTGLIWTTGAYVLLGDSLNIISNILPILLFAIGTSSSVHLLSRYQEEYTRCGSRRVAAVRTLRHMALACLLTYLTTAIGFLSLVTARSHVLHEIAWETALGLVALYVATIAVLGALLPSLRPPRLRPDHGGRPPLFARGAAAVGAVVTRHPAPILGLSAALVLGCLLLARGVRVDCRLLETFAEDHPISRTMQDVDRHLGGVLTVDVDLRATRDGALLDPDVVRRVRTLEGLVRKEGAVLRVRSYTDLLDAVSAGLPASGSAAAATHAPPDPEVERSRLRLANLVASSLADVIGYRRYYAANGRRARVEVRIPDLGSTRVLALAGRLRSALRTTFPPETGVATALTGHGYVAAASMDHFVRDLLFSLLSAAVVIFGVIALLFRSPRLGLISVLPNLTPLLATIGYMRLRGYALSGSSTIVFAISLGMAVDNTIHFLARFREEWAGQADFALAIRGTMLGAGRAMVLTSVLIVLGMAVMYTSEFVPTRQFGELTSVTMAAALFGDLLLLPVCLRVFGPPRPRAGAGTADFASSLA